MSFSVLKFYIWSTVFILIDIRVDAAFLGGILCRQPKDVGHNCGRLSSYSSFYFDADIGECIEFMFKGCGGNNNRFTTREECIEGCGSLTRCGKGLPLMDFAGNMKRCDGDKVPCPGSHECVGHGMNSVCCLKADRICNLPVETGSICGAPPIERFYFDGQTNTCRSFGYTGCGGNDNNFHSKGQCLQFCSSEVTCKRGDALRDRYSTSRLMTCIEGGQQCPRNYTCTKSNRGKGSCCPSKEMVCGSPFDGREPCRRPLESELWSFHPQKGQCERVQQKACGEQLNSFANMEQCVDYCIGTCPNNADAHLNPFTSQPQLCDPKNKEGCPIGYECIKTSPFSSICCRTYPVCPAAESILLVTGIHPVQCEPSRSSSCPNSYTCQTAKNRESVCCTPALSCPQGMNTLRIDGGRPRACTPRVDGSCPNDHLCVLGEGPAIGGAGSFGAKHLCCKPEQRCVVPYVDPEKKKARKCYPGDGKCPLSTQCLPAVEGDEDMDDVRALIFYCCHTVDLFTCSEGRQPLEERDTKRPKKCARSDPDSCPSDYLCEILQDGTSACCPHPAAAEQCVEAVTNNGEVISCKGWADNSCPNEGKCRKALNGQYICCKEASLTLRDSIKDVFTIPY